VWIAATTIFFGGVAVRKVFLVIVFILLLVSASFSLTAIAENGKTVILNPNGTWKYDTTSLWRVVRSYTGSSSKNTDPFTISGSSWRIKVTSKASMFSISLYNASTGRIEDVVISMNSSGTDETYIYKKGTFYLSLNAIGSYEIVVEEMTK
jgi:hypothetical protein